MPKPVLYEQVYNLLYHHMKKTVNKHMLKRLSILILGIINSESASPASIAEALAELDISDATAESIERRIRRIENDSRLNANICFYPIVKDTIMRCNPEKLILIMDPTTQEDKVVKLTAAIWYRGKALPLAWMTWPANQPLKGDGFWKRVDALLNTTAKILPEGIPVIWLADRAFGSPSFIDLVTKHNWHYLVRVVKTTRCKDILGVCQPVSDLVPQVGCRAKMRGYAFKKEGWRSASVVAYWGKGYKSPLCLVTDLPPDYKLIHTYLLRYPIESMFRDEKSSGWHWEQGQVTDPEHMERLLVEMALATWVAMFAGTQVAGEYLSRKSSGSRRSMPWIGKRSLFHLGLQRLKELLRGKEHPALQWQLTQWNAPNWQKQIYFHHIRAYILGPNRKEPIYCYV